MVGQVLRGSGSHNFGDVKPDPCSVFEKQVHCVVNISASIDGYAQSTHGFTGDGVGVISAQSVHVARQGTEDRYVEVERMDFEGEGKAATTC